jgi:hypothetical protein
MGGAADAVGPGLHHELALRVHLPHSGADRRHVPDLLANATVTRSRSSAAAPAAPEAGR